MGKIAFALKKQATCVAILGGAFDPPHFGHIYMTAMANLYLPIEHTYIVPSANRLDKPHIHATATQRIEMLRGYFKHAQNVSISDYELQHPQQKSRTFHTLKYFTKHYKRVYLLMGQDAWAGFNDWYQAKEVRSMAKIVVFSRTGFSSLDQKDQRSVQFIQMPPICATSSQLRLSIKNGETKQLLNQLPHCVLEYIHENKLYKTCQ